MALTIRNKSTEAMVRELGKRWNAGPSATVRRLAERELGQSVRRQEDIDRDLKALEALAKRYPPPDDGLTWAEVEAEMQSLFDYLDDEPASGDRKTA